MKLWTILVPTVRNDGRPFRLRYHRLWDDKVRTITGGLTILQPAKGQWVAPDGRLFHERMIPVILACSEPQIEAISDLTARHYEQEAVMYWLVSDKVVIKHYGGKNWSPSHPSTSKESMTLAPKSSGGRIIGYLWSAINWCRAKAKSWLRWFRTRKADCSGRSSVATTGSTRS